MTDLEGVAGVISSEDWCDPASRYYGRACEMLTRETNAAVEGFLEAGATEILVADGHGCGAIDPTLLHPRAELVRNWPEGGAYPFSLDDRAFDAAAWIGQHPKSGTVRGHLCHTNVMAMRDMTINGVSVGEFGELVLCAGELGVRCIFAAGCEAFCREARDFVPGIETAAVKRGTQTEPGHHLPAAAYRRHNSAAIHLSPEEARRRVREGARRALDRARREEFGLVRFEPPYELVAVYRADQANPPRVVRQTHPSSVIVLLNAPRKLEPICEADPLTAAIQQGHAPRA
jgi:D-amino peptidase